MTSIVHFENVTKQYQIGYMRENLREVLSSFPRRLFRKKEVAKSGREFTAINDLSLDLQEGQILGIIGHNGAGKTTILKLISRVTRPTSGVVSVNGRVSALIELGAGFHPDLTGRENIYLNGVILGLTRKEIGKKFDQIVEFAELSEFIDTPVKRYSSGMYARLGFAVAAHTNPDLMLVDEVLAVGDEAFQRKCFEHLRSFVKSGKTAIFVSHNLYAIEQLCNDTLWIDHGAIRMAGSPANVLSGYLDNLDHEALHNQASLEESNGVFQVIDVSFRDHRGNEQECFLPGEDITAVIHYRVTGRIEKPHFSLVIIEPNSGLPLINASMLVDGKAPASIAGEGYMCCRFMSVPLQPRTYSLWGEVFGADQMQMHMLWQRLGAFRIAQDMQAVKGLGKGGLRHLRADGPIHVPHEWEY